MAWSLIQHVVTNVTATSWSFTNPVTSGNIVAGMIFSTGNGVDNLLTIGDDQSNTYSEVGYGTASPSASYAINAFWSGAAPLTNGPKTISTTWQAAAGNQWMCMGEWAPPAGTLSTDGFTSQYQASASNNPPSAGNLVTTKNGDLIIVVGGLTSDSLSVGSGYSLIGHGQVAGNNGISGQYQIQSSSGSIAGQWGGSFSGDGIFAIMALAAVGAAAAVPNMGLERYLGWYAA